MQIDLHIILDYIYILYRMLQSHIPICLLTPSLKDIPGDDLRLVELAVPMEPVTVQVQIDGDKTP